MINEKYFNEIHKELIEEEKIRDLCMQKSRDIIRISKKVIYSLHRDEIQKCEKSISELETAFKEMKKIKQKYPNMYHEPSLRIAEQEIAEALLYYSYVVKNELWTHDKIEVSVKSYINGISDLGGELLRRAVYKASKGHYEEVNKIRDFLDDLYLKLLELEIKDNEVRKKMDGFKYILNRLDDVLFEIKIRGKEK